jgi:hypothetical protein
MAPSEIEPATFQLLALCLTQLRHRVCPVQTVFHIRVGTVHVNMFVRRTRQHSPSSHNSLVTATECKSKENVGTDGYFATNNTYTRTSLYCIRFFVTYHLVELGAPEEQMATHQRGNSTLEDTVIKSH